VSSASVHEDRSRDGVVLHESSAKEVNMATGKKPASDAGKVLADPKSTPEEKKIAASDLAQTPKKGSSKQ
jgi:hypothetical protein